MKSFVRLLLPVGAAVTAIGLLGSAAFADATNTNTQAGANSSILTQSAASVSGDAAADGANSVATSGDATASAVSDLVQRIIQDAANQVGVSTPAGQTDTNSNDQSAANASELGQTAAGVSGVAAATAGGAASSAASTSTAASILEQIMNQVGLNQGAGDDEE